MQGVTVQDRHFAGSVLEIFRPLPIISGITLLFGYAVLGAGWLRLKSNVSLQHFASRSLRVAAPAFAGCFGIACIYALEFSQAFVHSGHHMGPLLVVLLVYL